MSCCACDWIYFVCLIVLSSTQPTSIVSGWRSPVVEERSYELNHSPRGEAFSSQRKTPVFQRDHYSKPGYHSRHDYYFHSRYEAYTTESYDFRNREKTSNPRRNNRQGEDSDTLTRRTIDVGQVDNGRQSFGNEKSTGDGKETLTSGRSRNVRSYGNRRPRKRRNDSNVTPADMTYRESTENDQETTATPTTNPVEGGNISRKRPGFSGGGKGAYSRRGGIKPKNPPLIENRNNRTQTSVDFVFPDNNVLQFAPHGSTCGPDALFCEDGGDAYPKEYIAELLKKEGDKFKELFSQDLIPEMNITERVYKDEVDLCTSVPNIVYPKSALSTRGEWEYVVNLEDLRQALEIEVCLNEEKPCKMAEGFPLAYKSSCKQKYMVRKLLSLDRNGAANMNNFRLPSCCVCVLHSVGLDRGSSTKS